MNCEIYISIAGTGTKPRKLLNTVGTSLKSHFGKWSCNYAPLVFAFLSVLEKSGQQNCVLYLTHIKNLVPCTLQSIIVTTAKVQLCRKERALDLRAAHGILQVIMN